MSLLILFTLFAPLIFSFFFAGLETQSRIFSSRTFLFASFGLFAILVSLGISNYFMDYLIELYSFIDIRSLSHNDLPSWLVVISTFLVLDLANYLIHRFIHFVPFLWRFHRLHHSDRNVDALTTVLHHPLEVFINSIFIVGFYVAFDLPIILIIFYDIALAIHDAFAHASIRIPRGVEKWFGYIFVMPIMHRAHHSIDFNYGNANYGSIFSIWDRLLGTYKPKEVSKVNPMIFGVDLSKTPKDNSFQSFLVNPLV